MRPRKMNWDFSRSCQIAEAGGMGQQTECTRGIQTMLNENHYLTFLFLIRNMCLLLGVCAWRHGCLQKPEVLGSLELEL